LFCKTEKEERTLVENWYEIFSIPKLFQLYFNHLMVPSDLHGIPLIDQEPITLFEPRRFKKVGGLYGYKNPYGLFSLSVDYGFL